MNIELQISGKTYSSDLSKGIDLSTELRNGSLGPNCFHATPFHAAPFRSGDFVGVVSEDSPVNFYEFSISPHGNGTHTECRGHIEEDFRTINNTLKEYHFIGDLLDIFPEKLANGDRVIGIDALRAAWGAEAETEESIKCLLIRTLPNPPEKANRNYSGTNPPYFSQEAMQYIVDRRVQHLLVDLPSVDREEDGGALRAHKTFWDEEREGRESATITELIYVPDEVEAGRYLIAMHVLNIVLDASPSRVMLYEIRAK